jgi:hypothetical protein
MPAHEGCLVYFERVREALPSQFSQSSSALQCGLSPRPKPGYYGCQWRTVREKTWLYPDEDVYSRRKISETALRNHNETMSAIGAVVTGLRLSTLANFCSGPPHEPSSSGYWAWSRRITSLALYAAG